MASASIRPLTGSTQGTVELPAAFHEEVRVDLIRRAVLAEESLALQPKSHDPLAGMNTTARYYGAMNSYRSGRHMGRAIRPRQKLGGGRQGDVRRIPSGVKGRRAHPHMIEKTLVERINRKEYQKAIRSAVAATADTHYVKSRHNAEFVVPIVITNDIESVKKTKDVMKAFESLKLSSDLEKSSKPRIRKGLRRLSQRKTFRKSVLLVVKEDKGVIRAARNIPGVDVCTAQNLRAKLLAPGGTPGRVTVWSEGAVKSLADDITKLSLE